MPKRGQFTAEFDTCVRKVKKSSPKVSAYAVCIATFRKAGKKIWIDEDNLTSVELKIRKQLEWDHKEDLALLAWVLQKQEV